MSSLGDVCLATGEDAAARSLYEQQHETAQEIGDRRQEGEALGKLADVYAAQNDFVQAHELYLQGITIAQETSDQAVEVSTRWRLGKLLVEQGEWEQALLLLHAQVDYRRTIGHTAAAADLAYLDSIRVTVESEK